MIQHYFVFHETQFKYSDHFNCNIVLRTFQQFRFFHPFSSFLPIVDIDLFIGFCNTFFLPVFLLNETFSINPLDIFLHHDDWFPSSRLFSKKGVLTALCMWTKFTSNVFFSRTLVSLRCLNFDLVSAYGRKSLKRNEHLINQLLVHMLTSRIWSELFGRRGSKWDSR